MEPELYVSFTKPLEAGRFEGRIVGYCDIRPEAATEAEAIEKARALFLATLPDPTAARFETKPYHPMYELVGHSFGDPDFDTYLEGIREFRAEAQARFDAEMAERDAEMAAKEEADARR